MAYKPIGLEGFDHWLVDFSRLKNVNREGLEMLPPGGGWLLAEFGANTAAEAEAQALAVMASLNRSATPPQMRLLTSKAEAARVWHVRESGLGVVSHVPGEPFAWEGWEDSAVAPEKLGGYLRDLTEMMTSHGYRGIFYGHFGHACVHVRINFDLPLPKVSGVTAPLWRRLPTWS